MEECMQENILEFFLWMLTSLRNYRQFFPKFLDFGRIRKQNLKRHVSRLTILLIGTIEINPNMPYN